MAIPHKLAANRLASDVRRQLPRMSIDSETHQPRLSNVTGRLSGPAIKPVALHMVCETARAVQIPIPGMGGIVTPEDAAEFLLAGAMEIPKD
jgi:dihydroorotate dehydrogenase (NAD+) catalytic subunit